MNRIFSNGPAKDFVFNPFNRMIEQSKCLYLAAPYFTEASPIAQAARNGKSVQLLIGLNTATSPDALAAVHGIPNLAVRYLTHRFHAKIYIFDNTALIGSANLTNAGLTANREAVMCLDQAGDGEAIEEIRQLFLDLWESARVLTPDKLKVFRQAWMSTRSKGPDPDTVIENAVGRAEPNTINVDSKTKSRERLFLDRLQREVYEQYRPAFNEVSRLLKENGLRRPELEELGTDHETNRFLNWLRRTYVIGDDAWMNAPLRTLDERRAEILGFGEKWKTTSDNKIPEDYLGWLKTVQRVFASPESIEAASKEELTQGLLSLHAFSEQYRFVKGGEENLPKEFWAKNNQDVKKVKRALTYLIGGPGDFIQRFHDLLYDRQMKPADFGYFCALELYGSIKPDECPPMNGRTAKALRYLGFDVRGN